MILQIENTSFCNASCGFCPHKIMKRQKGTMEESNFERILLESKQYPIDAVVITGIGEPLLDNGIIEKLKIAKKAGYPVTIYTNGTNLKKYLEDLLDNGLDSLVISLNAATSDKRMSVMGIDYFDELDEIIKNWDSKCNLTICSIVDMGYLERFDCEKMQDKYSKDKLFFHYVSNWGGQYNFDLKFKPTNNCPRPFEIFHVNWDGSFVLCCLDYEGKISFGKSITEVINNDVWKFYRQKIKDGKRYELPLCKNCATV